MASSKSRELAKAALRLHCAPEGPSLEQAAEQVGLSLHSLRYFQRREWPQLCREVFNEELPLALPLALARLSHATRLDKSSAGITAAKTLLDLVLRDTAQAISESQLTEAIDFDTLSLDEREAFCRLLARAQRSSSQLG